MQKEIFHRITRIDNLIRMKATGTPGQLAERLGVSERSVYEYISLMKELGAPIKFDSYRESYYYDEEGSFTISFFRAKENDPNGRRKYGT
jgi:predicted DNA-binding transcriptional regulator YafY